MAFFYNMQLTFCLIAAVLIQTSSAIVPVQSLGPGFLQPHVGQSGISTQKVQNTLRTSLNEVLAGGAGVVANRLSLIEARLSHTYQALPKNSHGRLTTRALRHLVHAYFTKEHGWLIKGLEAHTLRMSGTMVQEATILQDKVPELLEGLLEARRQQGISFSDAVAMVAALERLIFYESMNLLNIAYALNGKLVTEDLNAEGLEQVLMSYLLLFEQGASASRIQVKPGDAQQHQAFKARAAQDVTVIWQELSLFAGDTIGNYNYAQRHSTNPFAAQSYSFEMVSEIVQVIADTYGKWQNAECLRMKDELMGMDHEGTGRVPLGIFYGQSEGSSYQFAESVSYLRQIGALDEHVVDNPSVIIPNYVAGPTNCIATSTYYSVCCLSECEALMSELESQVQGPVASPQYLLMLITNMSSSSIDAPRVLPKVLTEKLHDVAARHGGEVPLHSRLFAQWLHYAYPAECPYPHLVTDAATLMPSQWASNKASASRQEVDEHIRAANVAKNTSQAHLSACSTLHWTDEEVLVLEDASPGPMQSVSILMRVAVMATALLLVLKLAATHCYTAWETAKEETIWRPSASGQLRSRQDAGIMEVEKIAF